MTDQPIRSDDLYFDRALVPVLDAVAASVHWTAPLLKERRTSGIDANSPVMRSGQLDRRGVTSAALRILEATPPGPDLTAIAEAVQFIADQLTAAARTLTEQAEQDPR